MADFKSVSLADQVFEKLENDIIAGVYPRGEVLTELKLVEQLGVSRTPIREALRRLEQERLIADSGKGSVVLGITENDLMDIMDIRKSVEALASFYACINMTAEGMKELRNIIELQEFYYAKHDLEHLQQLDDRFHDAICNLSGRTVIRDTLVPLHRKTRRYRKIAIENADRLQHSIAEHQEIFNAMVAKNPNQAALLTSDHIEKAKEHMITRFNYNG